MDGLGQFVLGQVEVVDVGGVVLGVVDLEGMWRDLLLAEVTCMISAEMTGSRAL